MTIPWRQYQEDAAELFRSLGFTAEVEAKVRGARSLHSIDVLVTLTVGGVVIRWLVECKRWRNRISKLHVVALSEIVKDVGADRAFILSEVGFQAGAISSARHTNVSLTSLEELRVAALEDLRRLRSHALLERKADLEKRLRRLLYNDEGVILVRGFEEVDAVADPLAACLIISMALEKLILGNLPIRVSGMLDMPDTIHDDPDRLLEHLAALSDRVEEYTTRLEGQQNLLLPSILREAKTFLAEVTALLDLSERSLCSNHQNEEAMESSRMLCLASMRRVGQAAMALKGRLTGGPSQELNALMRLLIDSVYLELTKPSMPSDQWAICRSAVEVQKERLRTRLEQ